ncbi:Gfo/Idh/MocA family oxidoreductase [Kribbella lupini]|uniref:Gfo/Idh/MocA family oxidoreductase n=1 Tax=Kribbella lupini TaxID=291602 RepID=A0ABP4ND38_9ACTN
MKIGVVGAGRHANSAVYPAILESGFELVSVCARTVESAQATAQRWGATGYYSGFEDMLAAGGIDGIVVVVPAAEYRPILTGCIEAGLPVFCEKPAGQSSAELREFAELAAASQCEVVVGYMKRFAPAYRRAHDLIRTAEFGTPSLAHFTFVMGQFDGYVDDLHFYLTDNPVHMIDLARFLVGELTDISAVLNVVPGFGLDVSLVAKAGDGAVCSFDFCTTASFAHRGEAIDIYGRGNAVQVDNVDTCTYRPADRPAQTWRPNYTLPWGESSSRVTMGFVPALEHFREVAAGRAANESDLASAARTLETAEQLYQQLFPSWSEVMAGH